MIFKTDQKDITTQSATAVAHANIALIKYWGKRQKELNLPAVGSISLTLDALKTETTVRFDESLNSDYFELNGSPVTGSGLIKVSTFLDYLLGGKRKAAGISSTNNFPTAAGLASSASGFAALTLAAAEAYHKHLTKTELSQAARVGSGSAARSIFGGFVEMKCGNKNDGTEDYAFSLHDENYWDIRMLIAVTSDETKAVSSTAGMDNTALTSPFFNAWVTSQVADLHEMREAIEQKDFEKMGELTEHSCFKMHGLALSARPPILYWNDVTVETIKLIQSLRKSGIAAYLTMDAGPQVKILCLPEDVNILRKALETTKGIKSILECRPGSAAALTSFEKVYN